MEDSTIIIIISFLFVGIITVSILSKLWQKKGKNSPYQEERNAYQATIARLKQDVKILNGRLWRYNQLDDQDDESDEKEPPLEQNPQVIALLQRFNVPPAAIHLLDARTKRHIAGVLKDPAIAALVSGQANQSNPTASVPGYL